MKVRLRTTYFNDSELEWRGDMNCVQIRGEGMEWFADGYSHGEIVITLARNVEAAVRNGTLFVREYA